MRYATFIHAAGGQWLAAAYRRFLSIDPVVFWGTKSAGSFPLDPELQITFPSVLPCNRLGRTFWDRQDISHQGAFCANPRIKEEVTDQDGFLERTMWRSWPRFGLLSTMRPYKSNSQVPKIRDKRAFAIWRLMSLSGDRKQEKYKRAHNRNPA